MSLFALSKASEGRRGRAGEDSSSTAGSRKGEGEGEKAGGRQLRAEGAGGGRAQPARTEGHPHQMDVHSVGQRLRRVASFAHRLVEIDPRNQVRHQRDECSPRPAHLHARLFKSDSLRLGSEQRLPLEIASAAATARLTSAHTQTILLPHPKPRHATLVQFGHAVQLPLLLQLIVIVACAQTLETNDNGDLACTSLSSDSLSFARRLG